MATCAREYKSSDSLDVLPEDFDGISNGFSRSLNINGNHLCSRCGEGFHPNDYIVKAGSDLLHTNCFVCAQCFQPFRDGVFYKHENRMYCEEDYEVLFRPVCSKCKCFIGGRVIKALDQSWHPECLRCDTCNGFLVDKGLIRRAGKSLCRECNMAEKAARANKVICSQCKEEITDKSMVVKCKDLTFCAWHLSCEKCGGEVNSDAKELKGQLHCLRCFDQSGVPICAACRRPIEGRVSDALGQKWHVEHFVCAVCEAPFAGRCHYAAGGRAYCETHYRQLCGSRCYQCAGLIPQATVAAMQKAWCPEHFYCSLCSKCLKPDAKYHEFDLKPVCDLCYGKLPLELQRRISKMHKTKR